MAHQGNKGAERDLIARLVAGDSKGWSEFLKLHGKLIYGSIATLLARFSIKEPAVAEDIFAAVIERLLADRCAALRSFKSDSKFTTYLVTIARNRTYDHLRSIKRRPTVSMSDPLGSSEDGEDETLERVLRADIDLGHDLEVKLSLAEMLGRLATQDQLIIKLHYIEGLKDREVAELVGISADAVSARKLRALARLKELAGKRRQ
jgi:RNA polymerase sigma factor (sigma-70 family)